VNDRGGIHGRKIRLISLDDGYEPGHAADNTRALIEKEKVFALFGYVGTPTSNAAKSIFTNAKVPFIAPFTGAESMRHPLNRYIFNVRGSYYDETEAIVSFLAAPRVKKIAVFYQNDAYGQTGLTGVERALAKFNTTPIAKGTVERNSTQVSQAVEDIAQARPEAIVLISAYKSCAEFIREMKKRVPGVAFWNVSFVGSQALSAELGKDGRGVAISQVVPFPWGDLLPITKEHKQLVGHDISFTTLEGFIAAKVLVEGLRKAGKNLTRESLITALENAGEIDVGGFRVNYTPDNHNGSKYVDLTLITHNGKFIH